MQNGLRHLSRGVTVTKHRASFSAVTEPTPDHECLLSLAYRCGFIIATKRTQKMLDALVTLGMLKRRKRTVTRDDGTKAVLWRYTLPPKA